MTLIEKQMMHPKYGFRIHYYSTDNASHNLPDELLVAEGWTISRQEIAIKEWSELAMCELMEHMAYRFYEKAKGEA